MAQNDNATLVAAKGYAFTAEVGTARPTPAQIAAFNPTTFGARVVTLELTGTPTGGTVTPSIGGQATSDLPYNVSFAALTTALEALTSVGAGKVLSVTGTVGASYVVTLDQSVDGALSVSHALTGGTTPAATFTQTTAALPWGAVGHTSRDEMPEFGYDGGDKELKGSWQNPRLRRIQTDPYADYLTAQLLQFDRAALGLYYAVDGGDEDGVFSVDEVDNLVNEKALLVIMVDGNNKLGFYAPKADICRDEAISTPVDDLAALPIKATFLQITGQPVYEWINEDLFAI